MKYVGLWFGLVALAALPAAACGGSSPDGSPGCLTAAKAGSTATLAEQERALERHVTLLRWQLHDLDYSDTASPLDSQRKRAQYERALHSLREVRVAQAQTLLRTVHKAFDVDAARRIAALQVGKTTAVD